MLLLLLWRLLPVWRLLLALGWGPLGLVALGLLGLSAPGLLTGWPLLGRLLRWLALWWVNAFAPLLASLRLVNVLWHVALAVWLAVLFFVLLASISSHAMNVGRRPVGPTSGGYNEGWNKTHRLWWQFGYTFSGAIDCWIGAG